LTVGILGPRETGKTVFISLLENAAINYRQREDKDFEFNFHPAIIPDLDQGRIDLLTGKWPGATPLGQPSEYDLRFGYPRRIGGIMTGRVYLDFTIFDIGGEDVSEAARMTGRLPKEDRKKFIDSLSPSMRKILDSNVLVFLIDSGMIETHGRDRPEQYEKMLNYDRDMAQIISLTEWYKAAVQERGAKMYPIVFLTKFDKIETDVLKAIGLPTNFSDLEVRTKLTGLFRNKEREQRRQFGEAIMERFFPNSMGHLHGASLAGAKIGEGVKYDNLQFFFSSLATKVDDDGTRIPDITTDANGKIFSLSYSEDEYVSFIKYLGEVAKSQPGL
jgi:hypothetical protein